MKEGETEVDQEQQIKAIIEREERINSIKTATDFYDFMEDIVQEWRDGGFVHRDGHRKDVASYLDGIAGVMFAEIHEISDEENRQQPSWSHIAWMLDRAFFHT